MRTRLRILSMVRRRNHTNVDQSVEYWENTNNKSTHVFLGLIEPAMRTSRNSHGGGHDTRRTRRKPKNAAQKTTDTTPRTMFKDGKQYCVGIKPNGNRRRSRSEIYGDNETDDDVEVGALSALYEGDRLITAPCTNRTPSI